MNQWLHDLPVWQMALVVFAITYLAAGGILVIIMALAKGERSLTFKTVSVGLLSPLGIIFGLMVVFSVGEVWSDIDRAKLAVDREASAIRMVELLAAIFPGEPEIQIRRLIRRHIDEVISVEWPAMAKQSASLRVAAPALSEALQLALALAPKNEGQTVAQREIVTGLENAPAAHYPQPVKRELGQVDLPVCASWLHNGRDRPGPLRQSRCCRDRDRNLCDRRGRLRVTNRQPRPAVQWRNFGQPDVVLQVRPE
jgi:hypothetical protein